MPHAQEQGQPNGGQAQAQAPAAVAQQAGMSVAIERGMLVIRVPMNAQPIASQSGKTLVVASTHGNVATTAVVNGRPVIVGVNAYIKP